MKGQILDVYPEGDDSFRACVLEVVGGDKQLARVVNLETGETSYRGFHECESPIIDDIFAVEQAD